MYKSKYGRKNAKIKKISRDFYLSCKCGCAKRLIQFSVNNFLSYRDDCIKKIYRIIKMKKPYRV